MAFDDLTRTTPATEDRGKTETGVPNAVQAGTLLNERYLLDRQINQGGFGAVFLAHDRQMHDRAVVVKIPIDQRVDDPWFEHKFTEEVRALSLIDHPGVVVAIDSGRTPEGMPFLVMQYVDGMTLRAVMSSDGMPLDRVAEIVKQIGHALGAAHDRGIWHRDLKPENLMLQTSADRVERVRLIDFGIATVADLRNKYQTTTRAAGTVLYMAPEQALGRPSARTDIYAMGLIAYEMVTGRRPFIAENVLQLTELQRSGVRIKPSDLRPGLPVAAERLILRSLENEPSRRPGNARLFGDELHDALLAAGVREAGRQTTVRRVALRNGGRVAQAICAAGLLMGALYYAFRVRSEPPKNLPVNAEAPAAKLEARAAGTPSPVPESARTEMELAYWNAVKDSSEPRLYQDYLNAYPHGSFASLARTKLDLLKEKQRSIKSPVRPEIPVPDLPPIAGVSIVPPNIPAELKAWAALKNAKGVQPYRDFLAKFPHGMFASVAQFKIASLEKKGAAEDRDDPDK